MAQIGTNRPVLRASDHRCIDLVHSDEDDDRTAKGPNPMQFMLYVFPILIFVMSINFPAALPLYWVYSNLFTIVQNFFLYRNNDKEVSPAK